MPRFIENICLVCKNFYRGRGNIFCSRRCSTIHKNLTNNPAKRPEVKAKISASRIGKPTTLGKPCSEATRLKISKALKGGKTHPHPNPPVSEATREKMRQNMIGKYVGDKNPNWRGGTSPRDWDSTQYKKFRREVWKMDQGICQFCDKTKTECKLQVAHIKSWIEAPELRYDPNNGILLCTKCHAQFDRRLKVITEKGRQKLSEIASKRNRDEKGRFV